jgi:uncharacterized protein
VSVSLTGRSSSLGQVERRERRHRARHCDRALLGALASPSMYRGSPAVTVQETHASWVFIAGKRAYKIKKPVDLGFLDYSTLSRRHAACREEVRINRELAPDIYLGLRAITRTSQGFRLASEVAPGAIEYAVEMASFDERDTMDAVIAAGALTSTHLREVAQRLAHFHRTAAKVGGAGVSQVLESWRMNIEDLGGLEHCPGSWDLKVSAHFGERFVQAHTQEIDQRARDGHVRDCHGDLRCEHILLRPTVRMVDRIEFDPALRRTDIAADLAFLTMDLEAHDQAWAARQLVSSYIQAGQDPGSETLRSFYAAHRALVRAKVALIAAGELHGDARARALAEGQRLWEFSQRLCWAARGPVAILVCGLAASGKSTLAGELSRRSGIPVLCTDVLRKAAAGLTPTERAQPEHYSQQFTRATYERLGQEARRVLECQGGVIVDATCRSRADRRGLINLLRLPGTTLLVAHCDVPLEIALQRARRRLSDSGRVSDATPEIVAAQFCSFEALDELPRGELIDVSTLQSLNAQIAQLTGAVDRRLAHHRVRQTA